MRWRNANEVNLVEKRLGNFKGGSRQEYQLIFNNLAVLGFEVRNQIMWQEIS